MKLKIILSIVLVATMFMLMGATEGCGDGCTECEGCEDCGSCSDCDSCGDCGGESDDEDSGASGSAAASNRGPSIQT